MSVKVDNDALSAYINNLCDQPRMRAAFRLDLEGVDRQVYYDQLFPKLDFAPIAKTTRPLAVDLFCGAGGMSLGFEQAGFDIAAAVDYDPVHAATHAFNFPHRHTLCASVANLTSNELRTRTAIRDQRISVVFGGPPCQGASLMGKRALDDPRNALMGHFVRLATDLCPDYIVMENVKGLTVGAHRQILDEVIEALDEGCYEVVQPIKVLDASNYGVPQNRQRVFVLAARKGLPLPHYPVATHGENALKKITVSDAIGDLPDADLFEELRSQDWTDNATFGDAKTYAMELRSVANLLHVYGSVPRQWERSRLTSSTRTEHSEATRKRFAQTEQGTVEPISHFLRLHPDRQCNTLRAGTGAERGAHTSPRPIHPFYPRVITVREAARLHGYPDWFRFHSTKWHGFRQVGNSVPPPLALAVARSVKWADFQGDGARLYDNGTVTPVSLGDTKLLNMNMTEAAHYFGVDRAALGSRTRKEDTNKK